jgi:hypothetical protein
MKPRSDWYTDTDPRALAVFLECQRRMTASEKVQAVFRLNQMLLRLRAAVRRPDRDTVLRAYGAE